MVLTLSIEVKTMISNMEPGALSARRNASKWEVAFPEVVPLYNLVPVRGPEGEPLNRYRGVQRPDTKRVVSLAGERCLLVEHRSTAEAVHAVGETLEKPDMAIESLRAGPRFRTESIKLYAGGAQDGGEARGGPEVPPRLGKRDLSSSPGFQLSQWGLGSPKRGTRGEDLLLQPAACRGERSLGVP